MVPLPLLLACIGLGTAVLTWLLVGQLIRWAPRIGLLDRPNERSSHTRVTPRGGGIGFVVAIVLAIGVWTVLASAFVGKCEDGKVGMSDGGRTTEDGRQMADGERRSGGNDLSGTQEIRNGPAISVHQCVLPDGRMVPTSSASCPRSSVVGMVPLLAVLGAALFIAAISLWDDFKSLGPGLRFACHFAAAGAAIWALGAFRSVGVPLCPVLGVCGAVGLMVTLLWIVGLTNVYNFMDGIDGIAGVQGVVAGLAWVAAGAVFCAPTTAVLGAVLAAGCLGFLAHNWSPAKIFMGDVGSAFLGYLFAVVPLVAAREMPERAHFWPVFGGLVVWPFLGDGILTFVRRALKREKVWAAHRSHLYQRLTQTGWSHAQVSGLYAGWALVSAALAFLWLLKLPGAALVALAWPLVSLKALFDQVSRRERAARMTDVGCRRTDVGRQTTDG